MGQIHARKLLAHPGVELVAVVDPRPGEDRDLPFATTLPENLDFAVVATPSSLHASVAEPLLSAGLPCLVEKPLAPTFEEAQRLAQHPALSVNHLERFNPVLSVLDASEGLVYFGSERMAPPGQRGLDTDVLLDLMVHDLDLLLSFDGGEVTEIRGVGLSVGSAGVDIAEVWLETSTGCVANLVASRVSRRQSRQLRLVVGETYWSLDLARGRAERVRWKAGDLDGESVEVPAGDALERMHQAFLGAVRGENPYPVPGAEGARAVALTERIRARIQRE
jgi:predicted dehydrogenase